MHRVGSLFNEYGLSSRCYQLRVEDTGFDKDYDIIMCNMILHWLDSAEAEFRRIADATKESLVIIFRETNKHYQIPVNGKWFPTITELDVLAQSCGFRSLGSLLC